MRSNVHSWQIFLHEICGNRGTATGGSRGVGSRVVCIGLPLVRMRQQVQLSGGKKSLEHANRCPMGTAQQPGSIPHQLVCLLGCYFIL